MAAAQIRQLDDNCAEFGVPLHGIGDPGQGIVHVIGPAARADPAGHDDRLRRLAHEHARRVRRAGVRDRDQRGRDGPGHADAPPARPEDLRGPGRRPPDPGGQRQGHHPQPDLADRHRWRHRARLRVHGRGDPRPDDGPADDRLQHEHRGRRACRAHRPRRHDVRVPPRPPTRSAGRGLGRRGRRWRRCRPTRARPTTSRSRSMPTRSSRWSPTARTPAWASRSAARPLPGRSGRPGPAPRPRARARVHGPAARTGDPRPEGRCRLRRQLHERSDQRPAARRERPQGPPRRGRRPSDGRPGLGRGQARGGARGPGRDLQGRRRRVARGRLLDVHRHERRPARTGPVRRQHEQPQLRGAPGQGRPDIPGLAADGRRERDRRRRRRPAPAAGIETLAAVGGR